MAISHWSSTQLLASIAKLMGRKMAIIAAGWVVVYFLTQPMRTESGFIPNVLTLFSPLVGALAGLLAGWYLANNAVEETSLHGMTLWVLLVVAGCLPMWLVEGIMKFTMEHATHHPWPMNFGGWMIVASGNLMALAASVWYASAQE